MNRAEYEREVYDHERQTGQHADTERYELLFQRYRLRIMRDGLPADEEDEIEAQVQRAISEAEENISDLLPEGYYCKIEED